MNSLVVFLSVMALVAAKPSVPITGVINYAAPAVAIAPAAVSHQSRVDIKSSPAVVATEIVAPVARTVIAEPALVASAPHAAHLAYAVPLTYAASLNYAAPVAIAPAAISSQSRVDIKSSPAIVSTYATAPLIKSSPAIVSTYATAPLLQPVATGPVAIAHIGNPLAYRAYEKKAVEETPVVLTEGSAPVPPSETPEVAAARAAHLEAKALEEAHIIQKRSAPVVWGSPLISQYAASPVVYAAPQTGRILVSSPYYRYY